MSSLQTIPEKMRLHAQDVPESFSGRVYFVLGPGLGDTVNDLRILQKVLANYPNAQPVVYADPRWKEIYPCIPELCRSELRFYSTAPSAMPRQKGKVLPFHYTFKNVVQAILVECKQTQGLVALSGFKLRDQLARKESSIGMKARAIGISLNRDECRPYFPLPEAVLARSQQFLRAQGLSPGKYILISPHTWADKQWDHQSWEILIDRLYKATGMSALVIGVHGYQPIKGQAVQKALGLPLPEVAALISSARCYIGLDTGPTHLAACFDIPIVGLNPQGKYPPFLVEPHSPYKWIHLTPGIYGPKPIPVASVFETVCKALECSHPPGCLVCDSAPYVLGAENGVLLYLCRCGLLFRGEKGVQTRLETDNFISPDCSAGTSLVLPASSEAVAEFRVTLRHLKEVGNEISLSFDHWDPVQIDPFILMESFSQRLWWNWDSAYGFLSQLGWRIVGSRCRPSPELGKGTFSVHMRVVPRESSHGESTFNIPWGCRIISVDRFIYECLLAWGAFRNQDELEGLGWSLANDGKKEIGCFILKMAFKVRPRWRTLKRLILAKLGISQSHIADIGNILLPRKMSAGKGT